MFFNKPNLSNTIIKPQHISILGKSSVGLYLAGYFQNLGHNTNIICSPSDKNKNTDIIIKNSAKLQSTHHKINTSYELTFSPNFLFIASELPDINSDLLLISPSKLFNTTIINLTPNPQPNFFSKNLNQKSISAFFNAWINKNGNTVSLNSLSPQIIFSLSPDETETNQIQNIFGFNDFELLFKTSQADSFWNWFTPRVLIYFSNIALKTSVKELSKTLDGRNLLDNCLNEISQIAYLDKVNLNKNSVLAELYSAPEVVFSFKNQNSSYIQRFSAKILALLFNRISLENNNFPTLKYLAKKIF